MSRLDLAPSADVEALRETVKVLLIQTEMEVVRMHRILVTGMRMHERLPTLSNRQSVRLQTQLSLSEFRMRQRGIDAALNKLQEFLKEVEEEDGGEASPVNLQLFSLEEEIVLKIETTPS